MFILSSKITNIPIMSVRDGHKIGLAYGPIINPHNLHIDGFYAHSSHYRDTVVLQVEEIREVTPIGIIIDDHKDFAETDELVRLQPIIDINFVLLGKAVETDRGRKLGKVIDYSVEKESFFVAKMYVQRAAWRSLAPNTLLIDRKQVVEVNDKKIIVRDTTVNAGSKALLPRLLGITPAPID